MTINLPIQRYIFSHTELPVVNMEIKHYICKQILLTNNDDL